MLAIMSVLASPGTPSRMQCPWQNSAIMHLLEHVRLPDDDAAELLGHLVVDAGQPVGGAEVGVVGRGGRGHARCLGRRAGKVRLPGHGRVNSLGPRASCAQGAVPADTWASSPVRTACAGRMPAVPGTACGRHLRSRRQSASAASRTRRTSARPPSPSAARSRHRPAGRAPPAAPTTPARGPRRTGPRPRCRAAPSRPPPGRTPPSCSRRRRSGGRSPSGRRPASPFGMFLHTVAHGTLPMPISLPPSPMPMVT